MNLITESEIVLEARTWLNVKWRLYGRSKENGVDCFGLVYGVGSSLGLHVANYVDYDLETSVDDILRVFRAEMIERPFAERQCGDVLLLRCDTNKSTARFPVHCAILSSCHPADRIIHVSGCKRKVTEDFLTGNPHDWLGCFSYKIDMF